LNSLCRRKILSMTFNYKDHDVWTKLSGQLTNISCAHDGTIWGVSALNEVYIYANISPTPPLSLQQVGVIKWNRIAGTLNQISVGNINNIWGISPEQEIFQFSKAEDKWKQIPGPAITNISVGSDDDVWAISPTNEIFHFVANDWQKVKGSLKQISVGNANNIWGVDFSDKIYKLSANDVWEQIPGSLSNVSVGSDGTVWGVSANQEVFYYEAKIWHKMPGSLIQISVGAANSVYGVNSKQEVYQYFGYFNWKLIPGPEQSSGRFINISVAIDGHVWGTNEHLNVFHYLPTPSPVYGSWQQIPDEQLHQLSALDENQVVGCNRAGGVFHYDIRTNTWTQLQAQLNWISISKNVLVKFPHGSSIYLYGVTTNGEIYQSNWKTDSVDANAPWTKVPGIIKQITSQWGNQLFTCYGVSFNNEIFEYNETDWVIIPGALANIAVAQGDEEALWGVSANGEVYQRNIQAGTWEQIPGSLKQISVGGSRYIWGIDSGGQIYKWQNSVLPPN